MLQVLRCGAYELIARADIPTGAVISEYVDVAHAFYDKREAGFVNGLLEAKDSTEDHTWSWTLGNRTSTALSEVYDSASGDFHYMSVEHSDGWASGGWLGLVETQVAKAA